MAARKSAAATAVVNVDPPKLDLGLLNPNKEPELPADAIVVAGETDSPFQKVARGLAVKDQASFAYAAAMVVRQENHEKTVRAFFDGGRDLAYQLHQWFLRRADKYIAPMLVRDILEPRMKQYRLEEERKRVAEQNRIAAADLERQKAADLEAARLKEAAEIEAKKLRYQGSISAARQVTQQAAVRVEQIVNAAAVDVGTILPDTTPKVDGVSDSMPWVGMIDSEEEIILAVAHGIIARRAGNMTVGFLNDCQKLLPRAIPLVWDLPKRGGAGVTEPVQLVVVNIRPINEQAKRLGKYDIGIPGAHGTRDVRLRFSSKGVEPGGLRQSDYDNLPPVYGVNVPDPLGRDNLFEDEEGVL